MGDSTKRKNDSGVVLRFDDPASKRAAVLEDDGRVAYAYLLDAEDDLVADVWLYNVAPAPDDPEWPDPERMPFLNPKEYCSTGTLPRIEEDLDVRCEWTNEGVKLFFDGIYVARLESGSKPGWSRLAKKRGPLATPLES